MPGRAGPAVPTVAGQAAAPNSSSTTGTPLILASASPRRRELLARLGITDARVIATDIDERPLPRRSAPRSRRAPSRRQSARGRDTGS